MLAGDGNAGGDPELFGADRSAEFAGVMLCGESLRDQVIVVRLPNRETRLRRTTNVAMATRIATAARISRARGFRAHFILLIYTGSHDSAISALTDPLHY